MTSDKLFSNLSEEEIESALEPLHPCEENSLEEEPKEYDILEKYPYITFSSYFDK